MNTKLKAELATFGAGCFWGVEETFRQLSGVIKTTVGYTGGTFSNPTYEDVCTGTTGHAESVQIEYDPQEVSYEKLLKIFWENHNPTTPDQQGADHGHQYRSVIFYHNENQKKKAEESLKKVENSHKWKDPIVTEIVQSSAFWPAEEYHQQYLAKRGLPSCHI